MLFIIIKKKNNVGETLPPIIVFMTRGLLKVGREGFFCKNSKIIVFYLKYLNKHHLHCHQYHIITIAFTNSSL